MGAVKLIGKAAKVVGRVGGVVGTPGDDPPVKARTPRVVITGLIVAWLVDYGVDGGVAASLVDLGVNLLAAYGPASP